MPPKTITIDNRELGEAQPCFIIAEAGVNHNGDLNLARQLVEAAVAAGADAVKFQSFKASLLVTAEAPMAAYQKETTPAEESQFAMLKRLELSLEDHLALKQYCDQRRIIFLSSPFDEESGDMLNRLGVPAFKVSSGELTNLPLLAHLAGFGKPLLLSTGMATEAEIGAALETISAHGNQRVVLLHCVSNYPAPPAEVNLRAMATMRRAFAVPTGFSDHTLGIEIPLAAVALGACVIEKHFTLDATLPGPDHRASLLPGELKAMVAGIRKVEAALGSGLKAPTDSELLVAEVARKSLTAGQDIPAGAEITAAMLTAKRPGTGISPARFAEVVGKKAGTRIAKDTTLHWDMLR